MTRKIRRAKDKGVTRSAILAALPTWNTVPDLEDYMRRNRIDTDVTVKTALKNLLADGVIEVVKKPYSCYDAKQYQWKLPF